MSELIKRLSSQTIIFFGVAPMLFSCAYFKKDKIITEDTSKVQRERYEALEKKYNELLSLSTPAIPLNPKAEINNEFQQIMAKKGIRSLDGSLYKRDKVARELRSLNRLQLKINKKRYGDAVLLAKELENSDVEQIRAQARFLLGEAMSAQGEQILALQIFEEVAISMPFSIFSKKSIQKGLELSHLMNDSIALKRFEDLESKRGVPKGSVN